MPAHQNYFIPFTLKWIGRKGLTLVSGTFTMKRFLGNTLTDSIEGDDIEGTAEIANKKGKQLKPIPLQGRSRKRKG